MNTYEVTFTDGTTETVQANGHRVLNGFLTFEIYNVHGTLLRDANTFVLANVRGFRKVER